MSLGVQDILTIIAPIATLIGVMWHHFNNSMSELKTDIKKLETDIKRVEEKLGADIKKVEEKINNVEKKLSEDINKVEQRLNERLGEKIDAVRDRVSRIEGQLVPAKVISFEEARSNPSTRSTQSEATQKAH